MLWSIVVICIGLMLPIPAVQADDFAIYMPIINTTEIGEIAFVSDRIIHTMREDGSNVRALLPDRFGYDPDYSPDGAKIVFVEGIFDISVMNADGTDVGSLNIRAAFKELIGTDLIEVSAPDWSPDGTKIALDAMVDIGMPDLFVINQDGTGLRQLTNTPDEQEFTPQWLPDGRHIGFWRNGDVYIIDTDGANLVNVTSSADVSEITPVWSPDGQKIAFSAEYWPVPSSLRSPIEGSRAVVVDPRDGIYVMNADGTGRVQLTSMADATVHYPAWSPDGEKIAFGVSLIDDPSYSRHLYVMEADGSNIRPLTNVDEPGDHYTATWSP